jgi:hypothetical protein
MPGTDRGSSKHGPKLDEEMQKEVEGRVRSGGQPTRAEEWHDPEPDVEEPQFGNPAEAEEEPPD